jgi:glycosyltransferase involved in cell wall biosynthesis
VRPTVGVVLCTYNGSAYLRAQLASLAAQTSSIDELVVQDDASSDDTVAQLEAHATQVATQVVIHRRQQNVGPAQNFSEGLGLAQSDLVLLCDQDDVWQPSKVERVVALLESAPDVDVLQHDAGLIGPNGEAIEGSLYRRLGVRSGDGSALFLRLLRRNLAPGCTLAVRRDFLQRALPIPSGFMHDEWLALFAAAFNRFLQVDERLMSYRLHADNTLGLRGLGAGAVVAGLTASHRRARAEKIERLAALQMRLRSSRELPSSECAALLDEALAHLRMRQALPTGFFARLRLVLAECRAGRYRRHGSGGVSALYDLLRI